MPARALRHELWKCKRGRGEGRERQARKGTERRGTGAQGMMVRPPPAPPACGGSGGGLYCFPCAGAELFPACGRGVVRGCIVSRMRGERVGAGLAHAGEYVPRMRAGDELYYLMRAGNGGGCVISRWAGLCCFPRAKGWGWVRTGQGERRLRSSLPRCPR